MPSHSILITGTEGYLGAVLVPQLLAAGHVVTAVDAFAPGAAVRAHPGLRIHSGGVGNIDRTDVGGADADLRLPTASSSRLRAR